VRKASDKELVPQKRRTSRPEEMLCWKKTDVCKLYLLGYKTEYLGNLHVTSAPVIRGIHH